MHSNVKDQYAMLGVIFTRLEQIRCKKLSVSVTFYADGSGHINTPEIDGYRSFNSLEVCSGLLRELEEKGFIS